MIVIPVTVSPRATAQLIGAAPRYRGSREAWTLTGAMRGMSRIAFGRMCPYAATTIRSGNSAAMRSTESGWRAFSGWYTGIPSRTANSFTGGEITVCPRPDGRSGLHSTRVTRSVAARAEREGTANRGVPMNTVRRGPGPGEGKVTLVSPLANTLAFDRRCIRVGAPGASSYLRDGTLAG